METMEVESPEGHLRMEATMARSSAAELVFSDESNIDDMYLTFGVGGEEYGIGIVHVTEIVGMQRIMEVPDVPSYIRGVINLRGKIIPVMDVRKRFSMAGVTDNERAVIVVLDMANIPIGLIVDNVNDVLEIPASSIDPPPPFNGGSNGRSVLRGLGKIADRAAIILDVERMVATDLAEIRSSRSG
jgi:purine-binding chemotaxis protein CheW